MSVQAVVIVLILYYSEMISLNDRNRSFASSRTAEWIDLWIADRGG